jgi:hypothetical protein
MMLPPAERDVLGVVVRRELVRLNPDMDNPRIDFSLGGEVDRRKRIRPEAGRAQQEVLVGAAPELAVTAFGEELAVLGVELEQLTLLPQVAQRLYQQSDGSPQPTACYVALPGGPLITFFHDGQLRLVVEPPVNTEPDLFAEVQSIVEHLERGNLYMRQQFRGVELNRLLVAVESAKEKELIEALGLQLGYQVKKFPGPAAAPGALIAMGAILDSETTNGLNLSPYSESPEVREERSRRRTTLLAASVVMAIAFIWAILSVATALKWSRRVEDQRKVALSRMATLAPMRTIAAQRQHNAQAVTYLATVATDRQHGQEILRGIGRAVPPGLQLSAVAMDRTAGEWTTSISGSAFGETPADVLLGIDRFFHSLPREVPMHDLLLTTLDDVAGSEFPAAMKFTITFIASPTAGNP